MDIEEISKEQLEIGLEIFSIPIISGIIGRIENRRRKRERKKNKELIFIR